MVGRMLAADARMQVTPLGTHPVVFTLWIIYNNMKHKAERRKILGYPLAIFDIAMEAMAHGTIDFPIDFPWLC